MKTSFKCMILIVLAVSISAVLSCSSSEDTSDVSNSSDSKFLDVVIKYADTMIEHGRDHYGSVNSPLFAVSLDPATLRIHEGEELENILSIKREEWGIRSHDRMVQGANPMQDQNLYHILYALTEITGDAKYTYEADSALRWFFTHCQSMVTFLYAWGEHIGWDFNTETIIDKSAGTTHEFARPWLLWDHSFSLAYDQCRDFALGLWNHQIAVQDSGLYSRHARYDIHKPGTGSEYPRHGGFYIAVWAEAYKQTNDREFLIAIDQLVNAFENRRNKATGALMAETQSPDLMWPHSCLSLAVDLCESAPKTPEKLQKKMRQCASHTDEVFLAIDHDLSPDGKGFMINSVTSTLEPGWWRLGKPDDSRRHFSDTWATEYGAATDAQIAMLCYLRYRQVGIEGYKSLMLDAAQRYLVSDPDTTIELYPGALADALYLMLSSYEVTGEERYMKRAEEFGQQALDIFFKDSPLPQASSKHSHYEAITRGDTLVMALLKLWIMQNRPGMTLKLEYNER